MFSDELGDDGETQAGAATVAAAVAIDSVEALGDLASVFGTQPWSMVHDLNDDRSVVAVDVVATWTSMGVDGGVW